MNAIVPGMVATDFYEDLRISPRLERTSENWRYALDCFGVPIDTVARETTEHLGEAPGRETGKVYSLLTPGRSARGIAKITWYRMSGKLPKESVFRCASTRRASTEHSSREVSSLPGTQSGTSEKSPTGARQE